MNTFKQFIVKKASVASGIRNLYKSTSNTDKIVNRFPVKTPFSIEINKNVLTSRWNSRNISNDFTKKIQNMLPKSATSLLMHRDIHDTASSPKKRPGLRKKRSEHHEKLAQNGYFMVSAFATAEEYDLEKLLEALKSQDLYEPKRFFSTDDNNEKEPDVLYATAKYQVGAEPRGIYFFREGTVVMWNFSDMESSNILGFLKKFEQVRINWFCEIHIDDFLSLLGQLRREHCAKRERNNVLQLHER